MDKSYRYPGVRPFTATDSDIFFGRQEDVTRLFKLLMLEKTVILFGKSGHGKSSIINAGIIPHLKNKKTQERFHYSPIEVRLGKVSGHDESPIDKVIYKLNEQFPDLPEWNFLDEYENVPVLWKQFKKKQSDGNRKFMLIFDQFEEFFGHSEEQQEKFRWELAELLMTEIPQSIHEKLDAVNEEKYSLLSSRFDVKILFSIRSDRLSLMHSMKDALPGIFNGRYEIQGLRPDQAADAIREPALLTDPKFVTHPFTYDDESMDHILKELLTVEPDGSKSIEAFHLQIICQACESKIEEKLKAGEKDEEINVEDLPEFKDLYVKYYNRQIEKLPVELRAVAQSVLENQFIFEDEKSGDHRRLSVDGHILKKSGSSDELLTMLENIFLIRREANSVGGVNYEIAHDTILEPILKVRDDRNRELTIKSFKKDVQKEVLVKSSKLFSAIFVSLILLSVIILNWDAIYLGYFGLIQKEVKPIVKLDKKLKLIINTTEDSLTQSSRKINNDPTVGAWESAQMLAALENAMPDSIKKNFYLMTSKKAQASPCCCWSEMKDQNDIRPSAWVVSTIGTYNILGRYQCNIINFFLDNQLENGSWSAIPVKKDMIQFSSTYATCHVLRALHNTLPAISDPILKANINNSIRSGVKWLLDSRVNNRAIWNDYPQNRSKENLVSKSLSGLAIHTLNLTGAATPEINALWLEDLDEVNPSITGINYRDVSDMFYKVDSSEAKYRDYTRNIVIPWLIIATVDAYRDGSFSQKLSANIWLNKVLKNLTQSQIVEVPDYIKSEILMSLRHLGDTSYVFK